MRIPYLLLLFLNALFTPLFLQGDENSGHVLYLIHKGEIEKALSVYETLCLEEKRLPDFSLLRQIALALLEQGILDQDRQVQLLSLFGAGLSAHERALPIIEKVMQTPDAELQMFAIRFIGQTLDESANKLLLDAMSSPLLPIRMEAAFALAARRHPKAFGQIESLMYRLPPFFKPYFPSLFCQIATPESLALLQHLLQDPSTAVRVATLEALLNYRRDDFLPAVRRKITQAAYAEQEIGATLIGTLKDSSSLNLIKTLTTSPEESVRLSALKSLYLLGDLSGQGEIESMAKRQDLFAIHTLSQLSNSEEVLVSLTRSPNLLVRLNATLALLLKRDPRVLDTIHELLIPDSRTLLFHFASSPGRSHRCLKLTSASVDKEKMAYYQALSFSIRGFILEQAAHLPAEQFLTLCQSLLDKNQFNLVPQIVALVAKLRTKESIEFLKKNGEKRGAPLIRAYCDLALFQLKESGPYQERLYQWVLENSASDLIQLRTELPIYEKILMTSYLLTERESSQLLIDAVQALVASKDQAAIPILVKVLKNGNPKNRYLFAGLLIRAVE